MQCTANNTTMNVMQDTDNINCFLLEPQAIAVSSYGWLMTHYGWLAGLSRLAVACTAAA